jgi:CBS domain-containing protein
MKIGEFMTEEIVSVNKNEDLYHVITLMEKHAITKIPVVENSTIVGIVTDNKIADKLGTIRTKGVPAARMHASTVMDKDFTAVSPDTELTDILKKVGEPGPTMLPVVMDGHLVGVVTKADLLHLVKSTRPVADIMSPQVITVEPGDRIVHARRLLLDNDIARLPVVAGGRILGIISDNEIAFALAELRKNVSLGQQQNRLKNLMVQDIMERNVITVLPDTTIADAARLMLEHGIGCLPVVTEKQTIAGIVTRTDVLKHLAAELQGG